LKKQKKRGRPAVTNRMVHTAVVLPTELIEKLKRDSEAAGRGLSTEIRDRLASTYVAQGFHDPKTDSLINAIKSLSEMIERDVRRKWHEHPYALAAFTAGVSDFLARHISPGDPNRRPDAPSEGPDVDPPDVVGRTLARHIWGDQIETIGIIAGRS
jgi:hypothetical protein